jgi:hypothetical protein
MSIPALITARRKKKHERGQPAEHNKKGKEATEAQQEEKRERTAGKAQHKGQGSNRSTPPPSLPQGGGAPSCCGLLVYGRACEGQGGEVCSEKRIAKGQHKERSAKKE